MLHIRKPHSILCTKDEKVWFLWAKVSKSGLVDPVDRPKNFIESLTGRYGQNSLGPSRIGTVASVGSVGHNSFPTWSNSVNIDAVEEGAEVGPDSCRSHCGPVVQRAGRGLQCLKLTRDRNALSITCSTSTWHALSFATLLVVSSRNTMIIHALDRKKAAWTLSRWCGLDHAQQASQWMSRPGKCKAPGFTHYDRFEQYFL